MTQQNDPKLTPQFEDALVYAARIHALQKRKGTTIPYISHLLAVTALVLESEVRGHPTPVWGSGRRDCRRMHRYL